MTEHRSSRPDVVAQLERYGTVLEGDAREVPAVAPHVSVRHRHRHPRSRAALAAAAAIALLAGALLLARGGGAVSTSQLGDDGSPVVEPSGPATSPRLVAGDLPPGLVPTAAYEGRLAPGASSELDRMSGNPEAPASTAQVFTVTTGSGPSVSLRLSIGLDQQPFADTPVEAVPVRGVDGDQFTNEHIRFLKWAAARSSMSATVSDQVSPSDLRAIVEALRARSDEPFAGFDPPVAPVNGWTVTPRAEHVVARGTRQPRTAAVSHAWYHIPEDPARAIVVAGYGPGLDERTAMLGTWTGGELRVLAGEERLVAPARAGDGFTTVAWVRADGTVAAVYARGIPDADIEVLVAGVASADGATWDALRAQAGATLRAEPVVAAADLPVGRVEVYGDEHGPFGSVRGACLTVPGRAPRCSAIAPLADRNPGGLTSGADAYFVNPVDSGQFATSLMVEGRWYGIGALPHYDGLTITADGAHVEVGSVTGTDDVTVFGAELPATAREAELFGGLHATGSLPGTTDSRGWGPRSIASVRP